MSTIQVRIDNKTKRAAALVFENLGLDISTAVKIYFAQVLRTGGIPFPLLTANGFTPEQEALPLKESKETRGHYAQKKRHAHSKVSSLFEELSS